MALLAFENHAVSPLGYLLQQSQRRRVANEVNSAILRNQKQELGTSPYALTLDMWPYHVVDPNVCATEPMLPTMVRQFQYMEDQLHVKVKRRYQGIRIHQQTEEEAKV